MEFVDRLIERLDDNLAATLQSIGVDKVDWSELAVNLAGEIVVSLVYLLLFVVLYGVAMLLLRPVTRRLGENSALLRHLRLGVRYLMVLGALLVVFAQFGASNNVLAAIARAGLMALAFFVGWLLLVQLINRLMTYYTVDTSLRQLADNVFLVVIVALGFVTVLAQFGFDVLSIVAGLGIVGIAVGFAAQSTLSNFIAGVTLLIERPFRIGDWVVINGQEGKVVKIALRTTWLRTRDNIFAMIPNDSVASSDIVNFSVEGPTRLNIPIGIAYKETARAARELILPILTEHPETIKRSGFEPRVMLKSLGESSIDLVAQAWIESENLDDQPKIMAEILEAIKDRLDAADIEIPFPHLQLFIDGAEGLKPTVEMLRPVLVPGK